MKLTSLVFPAVGLIVGAVLGLAVVTMQDDDGATADDGPPKVVVKDRQGNTDEMSVGEAGQLIRRLQSSVARYRARDAARSSYDEEAEPEPDADDEKLPPALRHPDGRRYSFAELLEVAASSEASEQLRWQAIRSLRRIDTPEARAALQEMIGSDELSKELRLEAAKALARPPHRDNVPDEIIAAIREETDPDVRKELAWGIARIRDRGAYMSEISELLADEASDGVREQLFGAVARSSWDPAARQQLLDIVENTGTSAKERQRAIRALAGRYANAELVAAARPLLDDADPVVRQSAIRIMARGRKITLKEMNTAFADTDPAVRAYALQNAMGMLPRLGRTKDKQKKQNHARTVQHVMQMATNDTDPNVRRRAVESARHLPGKQRNALLASAREDSNSAVRLAAYAGSSKAIARQATPDFIGALESADRSVRGLAYNQLRRLYGVKVPYSAGWNDRARAAAASEIRRQVAEAPAK